MRQARLLPCSSHGRSSGASTCSLASTAPSLDLSRSRPVPDIVDSYWAVVIGAIGGAICTLGLKLLEKIKLDDVVGAVPAHLFAGIWGTLAVCIAAGGNFGVQLIGILAIGAFVFGISWLLWRGFEFAIGVRVSRDAERIGQDVAELGLEAYPEFVIMPEELEED